MKKTFLAALICAASVVIAGCASSKPVEFNSVYEKNDVIVNVNMKSDNYAYNQLMLITTTITNNSNSTIYIKQAQRFKDLEYILLNLSRKNEDIPLSSHGEKIKSRTDYDVKTIPVKKGDSYTWELNLREYFRMKSFTQYSLTVHGSYYLEDGTAIGFTAKPLEFKIR